jgi:fatty acid desaturase
LKASNGAGLGFTLLAAGLSGIGLRLSASEQGWVWLAGQLVLAASLVEWFVLLHECGHGTLFRNRPCNVAVGHIAGFWALIPYPLWVVVHRQHHKWTGWQDLDPTTETLTRARTRLQRRIVNICWKYWIPIFSVVYRLQNYWYLPRLSRLLRHHDPAALLPGVMTLGGVYVVVLWWIGPLALARLAGVALLLALVAEDLLIVSQHSHIPMDLSSGRAVHPHRALDQERFTRSLRLPPLVSSVALHIDAHELHHMYPFVPGYRLRQVPYTPPNEVGWRLWIRAARRLPGDTLLFHNRRETGFDL